MRAIVLMLAVTAAALLVAFMIKPETQPARFVRYLCFVIGGAFGALFLWSVLLAMFGE